jgi:acetyl-CoA C-acetyltransferase
MAAQLTDLTPVIIATGEAVDRPANVRDALEPVALMAAAIRVADREANGRILPALDSLAVVGQVTWRYADPAAALCAALSIAPSRTTNAGMGGDTPIRLIHEAALRIQRGEGEVTVVVGGESMHALQKARAAKVELPWTPKPDREATFRPERTGQVNVSAQKVGAIDPVHVYPLYENASQAALGETPAEGRRASAELWAAYAAAAAENPFAWIRTPPSAAEIAEPSESNRLVAFPYPKLMTANPAVNQAAAVVVASLGWARRHGLAEDSFVYIWGGAAASEAGDYLQRDRFDRSAAQDAVLERVVQIGGGDSKRFDLVELYSCFPVVPKLAQRTLALREGVGPSVAGGLTFFGGPLNNYMGHATCAMVRALRAGRGNLGLLYANGGVLTKHHALVVSTTPPPTTTLSPDYSVQSIADEAADAAPAFLDRYAGPARLETFTVVYRRNGSVDYGVAVARTPTGERLIARVRDDDPETLARLTSWTSSPIGAEGHVRVDAYDQLVWELGAKRDRRLTPKSFSTVERRGRITVITINRPEVMNALHPMANEELSDAFDDFQADPEQWVAILTGAGDRAFSAGNDLRFTAESRARGEVRATPAKGFAGLTSRWDLTKPVIAAVNGVAMGGGFEIALACDLVIASDSAVFALPEPRVGLAALAGGLLRLPRQIGLKPAMGMILTGRRVSAEEGLALGFVNEVVAPDKLIPTALHWAEQILECSPMSVRASKEAVHRALDEATLQTAYAGQARYPAMRDLFRSEDMREGPLAFAQKRPPKWSGG